jgi:TonB family protein
MAALIIRAVLRCCWLPALAACATSQSVLHEPPADITAQAPKKLPPSHTSSHSDLYPAEAKRQGLTGRVLVQFQIDSNGSVTSERVLAADASSVLQAGALRLLQATKFDVSQSGIDLATPFRVSVLYCLPHCGNIVSFPGTEAVTVSGSPIPKSASGY